IAHAPTGVGGFVQAGQYVYVWVVARIPEKIVPLVGSNPCIRQRGGRWVIGAFDVNCRLLDVRMRREVRAHQPTVPRPIIFSISGGLDPDKSLAGRNEPLKCCLVRRLEYLAGGQQEQDCAVSDEALVRKCARILDCVYRESTLNSQSL